MERGVIAAPGIIQRLPRGFVMKRSINAEEIGFYLLYFDKVVIPGNNLVYIAVPGEDELVSSGLIARPVIRYSGSYEGDQVTNALLSCQAVVARQLTNDGSEDWVLHQFGGDLMLLPGTSQKRDAIRMSIASVLPVPPAGTPIPDIIEFKERKRADLESLHDCLDSLYLDIVANPDVDFASRKLINDLQDEINALGSGRTDTSSWRRYDLRVDFGINVANLAAGAALGATADRAVGLKYPIGATIGAIASLINISVGKTDAPDAASTSNRLAYLSSARQAELVR